MSYTMSSLSGSCRSTNGFGMCGWWNDFVFDSSRVDYGNKKYRQMYSMDMPSDIAQELDANDNLCDEDQIDAFVRSRPPPRPIEERQYSRQEQTTGGADQGMDLDMPEPKAKPELPKWVLPAIGGVVLVGGVIAAVMLKKRSSR